MRRTAGAVTALLLTLSCVLAAPASTQAASGTTVSLRLRQAIASLPVAAETRAGYDRSKFSGWVDADGDCRDTRDEVLADESLVAVHGCDIQTGKWRSYYDGVVTTDSSSFDIDHLVPLAEAWDSGAKAWTSGTRDRYANDLGDYRTLVAVSASANRSKGDRDPAEWMPPLAHCKYVRQWVAVKLRWRLTVDSTEKRFLTSEGNRCRDTRITVERASISRS